MTMHLRFKDTSPRRAAEAECASARRERQLHELLADAQLRTLRLQLQPHFLFNMLDTAAMMIRNGQTESARKVITLLGDLFRRVLEFDDVEIVTLQEELAFIDAYLELQSIRFDGRMWVDREIAPEALGFPVPFMILQPLVENAVQHGAAATPGKCRIRLSAVAANDCLRIQLVNDAYLSRKATAGHGIGLRNTRYRLRGIYGDNAALHLRPAATSMSVTLELPGTPKGVR